MVGRDQLRLEALDASLEAARAARTTLPAFSAGPGGFTIDEGYELGARRFARRVHSGWTRSGLKIGFTNQRRWKELGLDQPIWAPIYRQTLHERSAVAVEESSYSRGSSQRSSSASSLRWRPEPALRRSLERSPG